MIWKGRKLMARLLVVLGSVAIALAIAEVAVLVAFGEQVKFPRCVVGAPFGVRINQPNATYRHKSAEVTVWFRINGQGMRSDREFGYEKPDGVQRIVSLGDSFTIGYEVSVEETFSSVLERELRGLGHDVEVLNAGVSGYSNAEECVYLERELLKYDPDLVLVSFFENDLVDNVRTGLFAVVDGELEQRATNYVPAGGLGDFLNSNAVFNFLSERSNAFALVKERATHFWKRRMVEENVQVLDQAESVEQDPVDSGEPLRVLAALIFERIYRVTHDRGIPLVIQSIPVPRSHPPRLLDLFPLDEFPTDRPGLVFLAAKSVLDPLVGREKLYHTRSHGHWTPLAHAIAGKALARLIHDRGVLAPD